MVDPGRRFVVVPQQRSASIASSKMSPPLTKCKSQKLQKFSFLPKILNHCSFTPPESRFYDGIFYQVVLLFVDKSFELPPLDISLA